MLSRSGSVGFLLGAWALPALVAGALGWNGIWGSGSALYEYLIPVPVAGGVLHVPSFAILVVVILGCRNWPPTVRRLLPFAAAAVFVAGLSLQIDHDRLWNTLLTDYQPYGSPLRFDGNPLLLFVTCDGLSAFLYFKIRGFSSPARLWPALLLVPATVLGAQLLNRTSGELTFDIGASMPGPERGQEVRIVYVSGAYDEAAFSDWLASNSHIGSPWESANVEHLATYFTSSLQLARSRNLENLSEQNTVATLCAYDDDQSSHTEAGFVDCFAGRKTVDQRLIEATARNADEDRKVAFWLARAELCQGWEPPPSDQPRWYEIKLDDICEGLARHYDRDLAEFAARLGAESESVQRVRDAAADLKLPVL